MQVILISHFDGSSFGAPLVVCDGETCRWQTTHATRLPASHPVELIAFAYGYPPIGPLVETLGKFPK